MKSSSFDRNLRFLTHQKSSTAKSTKVPDITGQSILLDARDFPHRKQQQKVGNDAAEGQRQQGQAQGPGKTYWTTHRSPKNAHKHTLRSVTAGRTGEKRSGMGWGDPGKPTEGRKGRVRAAVEAGNRNKWGVCVGVWESVCLFLIPATVQKLIFMATRALP